MLAVVDVELDEETVLVVEAVDEVELDVEVVDDVLCQITWVSPSHLTGSPSKTTYPGPIGSTVVLVVEAVELVLEDDTVEVDVLDDEAVELVEDEVETVELEELVEAVELVLVLVLVDVLCHNTSSSPCHDTASSSNSTYVGAMLSP